MLCFFILLNLQIYESRPLVSATLIADKGLQHTTRDFIIYMKSRVVCCNPFIFKSYSILWSLKCSITFATSVIAILELQYTAVGWVNSDNFWSYVLRGPFSVIFCRKNEERYSNDRLSDDSIKHVFWKWDQFFAYDYLPYIQHKKLMIVILFVPCNKSQFSIKR